MNIIHETLQPLLKTKIVLDPQASRHYKLNNTGRFGFFIEDQFNINPNNYSGPDTSWGELKTINITNNFKACSIANLRKEDYFNIVHGGQDAWKDSFVFDKIKKTLFVFYSAYDWTDKTYIIDSYGLVGFREDSPGLTRDWKNIVEVIRDADNYGSIGTYSGNHLTLTVKGDSQYTYPSISFKTSTVKEAYSACKRYMDKYYQLLAEQSGDKA